MKPRRPTIKDSTRNRHSKRILEQVAARKAEVKERKLNVPRLIADDVMKRCSLCGYPFPPTLGNAPLEAAFRERLCKAHNPGQTSEDISQAAARGVREAAEKV